MDLMLETLKEGLPRLGLELGDEICVQLCDFGRAMVKQNEVMNLTGITEDAPVAKLHLLDSLTVLACADLKGKRIIDVGCGAGFPGVPLALLRPDCKLTLLDSLNKRLTFLETVCREVDLPVTLIHARAEEGGQRPDLRERYDVACARAVAALEALPESVTLKRGSLEIESDVIIERIDVSAQLYKANCPPAVLLKLPLVTSEAVLDVCMEKFEAALAQM